MSRKVMQSHLIGDFLYVYIKVLKENVYTNEDTIVQFYRSVIRLLVKYTSIFLSLLRHKKKTPIPRGLSLVLLNQVFPCFHCFNKTSPTHKPMLQ